jgi:hypothetical protein
MTGPVDALFVGFQQALAGRYTLERELGRGGMGIVYLAREVRLDRSVAIKLLPPALAAQPALRERFVGEARTAAQLSHPHIIPIYAVDEVGDFVYFIMAYIEGETLAQRVRQTGPLKSAAGAHAARGRLGARLRARPGSDPSRRQSGKHPARGRDRPRGRGRFRDRPAGAGRGQDR